MIQALFKEHTLLEEFHLEIYTKNKITMLNDYVIFFYPKSYFYYYELLVLLR